MESEKLNMTARYRYWYKVWMDDSESWVYKDEIGELDVCCGENEVYDKVQEHLRTGAFAYPAIGLGFRIVDVNKRDDDNMLYSANVICVCERDGHVEEWEESLHILSTPDRVREVLDEYIKDNFKTDDMENFDWTIEKVEKLK